MAAAFACARLRASSHPVPGTAVRLSVNLVLLCLLATVGLAAGAPGASAQQRPASVIVKEWNQALGLAEQELLRPDLPEERAKTLRERLARIRAEAKQLQADAREQIVPLSKKLQALGPPPAEGEPPEFDAVAQERLRINEDIAEYEARVKQAALAMRRVETLNQQIRAHSFEMLTEFLFKPFPLPIAPKTIATAVPEFLGYLRQLADSPFVWWQSLSPELRDGAPFQQLGLFLALAFALGIGLRLALLRWLGRDPAVEAPSYIRRFYGALAEGLANGMIPALLFGGLYLRVAGETAYATGLYAQALEALCLAIVIFVLAWTLPRTVLAPDLPAWRLVALGPQEARRISRIITVLAGVFALDVFFDIAFLDIETSDELRSLYLFITNSIESAGLLLLTQSKLWRRDETFELSGPEQDEEEEKPTPAVNRGRIWALLRVLLGVIAAGAFIASLIGYSHLGAYLIKFLFLSSIILGVLVLLRGLGRELIGGALRSHFVRQTLDFSYPTRRLSKFWARAVLDLLLSAAGVVLVLPVWGVPLRDIWDWTGDRLERITIGNITISMTEILTGLAVFMVALVVARLLQRLLTDKVLPNTALDSGMRNSLSTGFGYVGLTIAAALGVAALGLDLTNLAIVFGALSVGIGFGLQGVVNNFVSGMILLVERPIKVGDWVVVGVNEGFVKRIRLRATEIETFQRASIVIPNSEIVSNAVVNWTHRDRHGRVDVTVPVAYGSDVDLVMEVLERCLRENHDIVDWPAPNVLFRAFGDSSLEFSARGHIANIEYVYVVQSALLTAITKAFREAGIEVPFPQRDLHLKNLDQLADAVAGRRPAKGGETAPQAAPRLRQVEAGSGDGET